MDVQVNVLQLVRGWSQPWRKCYLFQRRRRHLLIGSLWATMLIAEDSPGRLAGHLSRTNCTRAHQGRDLITAMICVFLQGVRESLRQIIVVQNMRG